MQEGVFEEQARPSLQKVLFCRDLSKLYNAQTLQPFTKDDVSLYCQAYSLTIAVPCAHRTGTASVKFCCNTSCFTKTQTERGAVVTRKIVSALTLSLGPNPKGWMVTSWQVQYLVSLECHFFLHPVPSPRSPRSPRSPSPKPKG